MSNENCNSNWHIFSGGLPKLGDICKCGLKRATDKIGEVDDVEAEDE